MHEEIAMPFYHEPHFWVAVGFVIFMGIFAKYILPAILKALDQRGAAIADQLEQANRLRSEAEKLLAASKIQHEEAEREAKAILAQAEIDAKDITAKAAADLEQTIARRIAITNENIARTQANAIQQLRTEIIEAATETARQVIVAQLKNQSEDPAIASALQSIERKIH